jgi:hypothetical protein
MGRFNTKPERPRSDGRERICLYVDASLYRRLKALCVLEESNVSQWFDARAREALKGKTGLQ